VATFSSVRSANMAARIAERSLQVGSRPVLMASRLEDPGVKINFLDEHWVHVRGGMGVVEAEDGNLYMVMGLRNAGSGMAILHGWFIVQEPEDPRGWSASIGLTPAESARELTDALGDEGSLSARGLERQGVPIGVDSVGQAAETGE
jgi:hypothetical protein